MIRFVMPYGGETISVAKVPAEPEPMRSFATLRLPRAANEKLNIESRTW